MTHTASRKSDLTFPKSDHEVLVVESLEPRVLLSSVAVTAYGQTGEEQFDLIIKNEVVASFQADTNADDYTYSSEDTFSAGDVRIQFTNDLYDPANNFDRNLIVDKITVDGIVTQTEDPSTFGTGTWTGSSIEPGFNQTETLHANGYFQYATGPSTLSFGGYEWNRSPSTDANEAFANGGVLTVSGSNDASNSIWTTVDIESNQLYEFSVDAWREVLSGSIQFDSQPWVTAGVDLYDADGFFLSKEEVQLFGPTDPNADGQRTREFFAPSNAAFASLWVWAQDTAPGVNIPVRIRSIGLQPIDSADTTPPNVELVRTPITEVTNGIDFSLRITDESGVSIENNGAFELRIDGPNGFSTQQNSIAGGGIPGGIETFYELGGLFTDQDNGEYVVTVNGGQFRDTAGNFVPESVVGSILVQIPPNA